MVGAVGNVLDDGDAITPSSTTSKSRARRWNIRLIGGDHDIDCRIDGIGAMKLKSEFVRKA
jgi:protein PhnA